MPLSAFLLTQAVPHPLIAASAGQDGTDFEARGSGHCGEEDWTAGDGGQVTQTKGKCVTRLQIEAQFPI